MAKNKIPFKKHQLKPPLPRSAPPPADKPEATAIENRGYFPGANYTMAELEFIKAVDQYRNRTGHKFPSAVQYMRLLMELGYRREFTVRDIPLVAKPKPKRKAKEITGRTLFDTPVEDKT